MHERRGADAMRRYVKPSERPERIYREEAKEIEIDLEPYKWYPQRAGRVDLIIERAKETGRNSDPVVRQEIAKLMIMARCAEWTARRARAAHQQGRPQGPEGSLGKLASSYIARAANQVHTLISGADAMLTGKDSPMNGRHRGNPGLDSGHLDCRRDRRDPEEHHLGTRAQDAEGADGSTRTCLSAMYRRTHCPSSMPSEREDRHGTATRRLSAL